MENLRSEVTPYAFELITAQYTLSLKYRAELIEDQHNVDVWHRQYKVVPHTSFVSPGYVYDDSGNLSVPHSDEDFGLYDDNSLRGRTASIVSCSCQFGVASGLDLCRHRMNRISSLIDEIHPSEYDNLLGVNVATKWLVLSPSDEAEATTRLRLKPTPPPFALPTATPVLESKSDRYGLLMAEFKLLAETASQSSSMTQVVLDKIRVAHEQLLSGVGYAAPSSVDQSAGGKSSTPLPAAQSAAARDDPPVSKDWENLVQVMGERYSWSDEVVDDTYFGDQFELWMNHAPIAYKWGGLGKGKWHIGFVKMKASQDTINVPFGADNEKLVNCEVFFPSDKSTIDCALYLENYQHNPRHENTMAHYWTLLEPVGDLGEDLQHLGQRHVLHPPAVLRKRGVKRRRFKPAAGPASDAAHTARRKR